MVTVTPLAIVIGPTEKALSVAATVTFELIVLV
jgi:hypothetical protein